MDERGPGGGSQSVSPGSLVEHRWHGGRGGDLCGCGYRCRICQRVCQQLQLRELFSIRPLERGQDQRTVLTVAISLFRTVLTS